MEPKRDRSPIKVESAEANSTCGGENDFLIRFVFNYIINNKINGPYDLKFLYTSGVEICQSVYFLSSVTFFCKHFLI